MTSSSAKTPVRADGRALNELRPVTITRGWLDAAEGSVLVEFGGTRVLCAASFTAGVPRWRKGSGEGWVTAEYSMLPRANRERSKRDISKLKISPRSAEIQRLVGRSLRAAVDMKALGLGKDDYVVTLSTCTSDESVRFVVQARWVGTYK